MRTHCLSILFHDDHAPVYSAHFESNHPGSKGRLATAGGDNNVRLWRVERQSENAPKLSYLSTLSRHTQAVNVVRWCPRGEILASAGDDGTVLLWVPDESKTHTSLGSDAKQDEEAWRVQRTCRSVTNSEIYDLAWSPDGHFLITGSMDNVARIFHEDGNCIRQIAEHSHYVQGVAWDPLNEFVATQSSDRSVHIYALKTKDGQFKLNAHARVIKMDFPSRRSSGSPAPPEISLRVTSTSTGGYEQVLVSPASSAPGTPNVLMNPPLFTPTRRSSFGNSPSNYRSPSPLPSVPLPAVKQVDSPKHTPKSAHLYHNEAMASFFRRLTFTPDGSLLLTPAGQIKSKAGGDEFTNTVYIYTRAGMNHPPVAHLPGHKKPTVAIKCSPVLYALRNISRPTQHITIDTNSSEPQLAALPPSITAEASTPNPPTVFNLPYRIVYAVATQDVVLIYDTQQQLPLCIVSNLHYATFTDLTWSADGNTLIMTSTDGFCSAVEFDPGELGDVHMHMPIGASKLTNGPPPGFSPGLSARSSSSSHSGQTPTDINLTPTLTSIPSVTAGNDLLGTESLTVQTPPQTPQVPGGVHADALASKRNTNEESLETKKKRRITPVQVNSVSGR